MIGAVITLGLILLKLGVENIGLDHRIELWTYQLLHTPLPPLEHSRKPQVLVIDISRVPGGKDSPTNRAAVLQLVSSIADQGPAAIAVDIDFAPKSDGWVTDRDPEFFEHCLSLAHGRTGNRGERNPVHLYLGVSRTIAEPPDAWLGVPRFKELAVAVIKQRDVTTRMPRWIQRDGDEGARLPTLSAAIANAYLDKHEGRIPTPPKWLHWAFRWIDDGVPGGPTRKVPGTTETTDDGKFRFGSSLVNYSKLDELDRESLPVTEARSVGQFQDRMRGKVVILGDTKHTEDKFIVPGYSEPVPGTLIQACAAETFAQEPLYEFRTSVRMTLDVALSAGLLIMFARISSGEETLRSKRRKLALWYTLGLVAAVGFLLVRFLYVMWLDFIMVGLALCLHYYLEEPVHHAWGRMRAGHSAK